MRVLFDTEQYVTTLKKYGVPDEQAHGLSEGLKAALYQRVATHDDIVTLKTWMLILTGLVALTSSLAMHILKAVGLFH
jgi:hypothetical protein